MPAQILFPGFAAIVTEGTIVGLTEIENVCGVPGQPFAVGVTVMVAVTGAAVELIAVNDVMLPVPLAARPIEGVLLRSDVVDWDVDKVPAPR